MKHKTQKKYNKFALTYNQVCWSVRNERKEESANTRPCRLSRIFSKGKAGCDIARLKQEKTGSAQQVQSKPNTKNRGKTQFKLSLCGN